MPALLTFLGVVVLALVFATGAVLRGDRGSLTVLLFGLASFLGGGVLMRRVWRRGRVLSGDGPPSEAFAGDVRVFVELAKEPVVRGEPVDVLVVLDGNTDSGNRGSLRVTIVCTESCLAPPRATASVFEMPLFPEQMMPLFPRQTVLVDAKNGWRATLPMRLAPESPVSFRSTSFRVEWRVEVGLGGGCDYAFPFRVVACA